MEEFEPVLGQDGLVLPLFKDVPKGKFELACLIKLDKCLIVFLVVIFRLNFLHLSNIILIEVILRILLDLVHLEMYLEINLVKNNRF